MSIRPKWLWEIMEGQKTVEVRKSRPKLEPPFKVYLYCAKGGDEIWTKDPCGALPPGSFGSFKMNGTVCAEFECDKVYQIVIRRGRGMILLDRNEEIQFTNDNGMCLAKPELYEYLNGKTGYGLRITKLKIYKKSRDVGEFRLRNGVDGSDCSLTRPPQSWCYVEEMTHLPQSWSYVGGST